MQTRLPRQPTYRPQDRRSPRPAADRARTPRSRRPEPRVRLHPITPTTNTASCASQDDTHRLTTARPTSTLRASPRHRSLAVDSCRAWPRARASCLAAGCTPPFADSAVGSPAPASDPAARQPSRSAASPRASTSCPQIEHIVIYMQENHSYDSTSGMLRRGDGFTSSTTASRRTRNPDLRRQPGARVPRASTCDTRRGRQPVVEREPHRQIDGGRMDGFARGDGDDRNAMRYWDGTDLPFYYGRSRAPSRCATGGSARSLGADVPEPPCTCRRPRRSGHRLHRRPAKVLAMPHPPNGTIWERLNAHGISGTTTRSTSPTSCCSRRSSTRTTTSVKTFDAVPRRLRRPARCRRCRSSAPASRRTPRRTRPTSSSARRTARRSSTR